MFLSPLTQHDKPLRLLDTVVVALGVAEAGNLDLVGLGNLVLGSVSDEDGLTTPLDDDLSCMSAHCETKIMQNWTATHVLALGDGGEINLDLGHGQNVGRGRHVDEELCIEKHNQHLSIGDANSS